jgi:hypothetical protein
LAIAVLASGGCATRRATDEPIYLHPEGPVAIEVDSFSGNVVVDANPGHESITVTVRREATQGYLREREAEASLDEIQYTAELMPGDSGQRLVIRTWTYHPEPYFQRADLRIEAPAVDGLTVRAGPGRVDARGIEGPVNIAAVAGNVRVMTNLPMLEPVTIANRDGDIDYRVRGESRGAFDCETSKGRVDHRVRFGRFVINGERRDNRLAATLNGGTNPIVLRTGEGDIRVAVVHNPEEVGRIYSERSVAASRHPCHSFLAAQRAAGRALASRAPRPQSADMASERIEALSQQFAFFIAALDVGDHRRAKLQVPPGPAHVDPPEPRFHPPAVHLPESRPSPHLWQLAGRPAADSVTAGEHADRTLTPKLLAPADDPVGQCRRKHTGRRHARPRHLPPRHVESPHSEAHHDQHGINRQLPCPRSRLVGWPRPEHDHPLVVLEAALGAAVMTRQGGKIVVALRTPLEPEQIGRRVVRHGLPSLP